MLHYSKRLIPVPPTYERIGAGLGRPFSDLIFAKWGFNNVSAAVRPPAPSERAEVLAGGERLRVPSAEHLTPPLQRLA